MKEQNSYKIDQRNKNDILQELGELAKAYTPEWKFETKNPDAGSVIGMIFANQTMGNIQRYNQVLDKYRMEFINMYGVIPKPARPAKTMVTVEPGGNGVAGVHLRKGTQLLGEVLDGEPVIFETLHDIYATTSQISEMFNVSRKNACVTNIEYHEEGMELFSSNGSNIRHQSVYLYHSYLFDGENCNVKLHFQGELSSRELAEGLTDSDRFAFYYLTEQGFIPIEEVSCEGEYVVLKKMQNSIKIEKNGQQMAVIELRMIKPLREAIILEKISVLTEKENGKPDIITDGTKEMSIERFMPFHQKPVIYNECYIGNDKIFSKKGTKITLEFKLNFDSCTVEPQAGLEDDLRIIKRRPRYYAKTKTPECYIQEIAVEYYNGREYRKLNCTTNVSELFLREENSGIQKLTFQAPDDWMPTVQGTYEGRCIRLQVLRADNCFFTPVCYYYPIITDLNIQCEYKKDEEKPEIIESVCGEEVCDITLKLNEGNKTELFLQFPYPHNYWYIGFDKKLEDGPIGLVLLFKENVNFVGTELEFQYSTKNGFKPLNVIDYTNQLESSGVILFEPPFDMCEQQIEGKKCWWIRVEDTRNYFDETSSVYPVLKKIIVNGVEAQNIETQQLQEYTIESVTANMKFPLYAEHILGAEVWVNESDQLSFEQMKRMLEQEPHKIQVEYNMLGEVEEFFVLWKEVESFDFCKGEERVYMIDRVNNQICFGDGKNVRIPQNVRGIAFKTVVQSCKGEVGNVMQGQIEGFQGGMLFIDSITNPVAAYGGSNMENIEATLCRGSNILSGRKRLVSEQDYLREAKMFSDVIIDAACICGEHISGEVQEDVLSIVLLMKDYKDGAFSFRNIESELKSYLLDACEMLYDKDEIAIVQPIFVKVSVDIWIEKREFEDTYELRQSWLKRVEEYLEPIKEDGTVNWNIGKLPTQSQIRRVLSALENEVYIKFISVKANYTDQYGAHEVRLDDLKKSPFMVCCNGIHHIYSIVDGGGKS